MGLFGDSASEKSLIDTVNLQAQTINRLTQEQSGQQVRLVIFQSFNNKNYIAMSLTLPSNQKAPIIVGLVDGKTLLPVTATFSGTTNTIDNTAIATVDASGNLVGVAAGTANLTTSTSATYTDSNTQQPVTAPLTLVTPVTITAVVTAETVQLVVSLGTPVAQ
jgi:hypothetical protein